MHPVHAPAFNRYRSLQSKSLPLSHVVPSHPQPLILNAFTFDLANQRFHKKPLLLGITPHIMGGLQMLIIIKTHLHRNYTSLYRYFYIFIHYIYFVQSVPKKN